VSKPGAPREVRFSREIDAYPANARAWQAEHNVEASEEINALFGYGSQFAKTHGFYIDGVDERTAMLPPDWRSRAAVRSENVDGRRVRVVAPGPEDLIVSKAGPARCRRRRCVSRRPAVSERRGLFFFATSRKR